MFDIPLSVPSLKGNEWKYVKECIDTEWVSSSGNYVDLFEQKIAEYTGTKYAVACVNGTSALQVSLRLAGVAPGDEVRVAILELDVRRKRLRLSMKQAESAESAANLKDFQSRMKTEQDASESGNALTDALKRARLVD